MLGCKKMGATSITTPKCLYSLHWLYIRGVNHSGSALVLILQEQVYFPPQNAQMQAIKPQNGGTLDCKEE